MDNEENIISISHPLHCAVKGGPCRASCQMAVTVYEEGTDELWFCGLNAAASAIHCQKDHVLGINYMHTGDPVEGTGEEVVILQKHQFGHKGPSVMATHRQ